MKLLYVFLVCLVTPEVGVEAAPPNFVFILADDQGWNALSTPMDPHEPGSGSAYYDTPRLARLAAEGMRFSQAYAPAPTCSPSRHAILFGRSPTSLKIFGADSIKDYDAQVSESLPHVLKSINPEYVCAHLGKWHIDRSPSELGYDVHDGNKMNLDGNSTDPNDPKLIFDLSRRSNAFMKAQVEAGKPFFLQISHYANHLKYQAREETIRKYETERVAKATPYQNSPLWAAMNENLDTGIGMVLDRIEELGIADNTYVIYTADNGYEAKTDFGKPVHERGFYKAYPQRSHKYHVSEGGIRVPFIIRGPGIPANTFSTVPVVGTDVFATVMDLAGGPDEMPTRVEGASLASHAKSGGQKPVRRKDPFLVFKYTKERAPHDVTIVQGDYKLIKDIDTGRRFLFNLKTDIGESRNLAMEKPELAKRMYDDMSAYFARFGWDESQIKNTQRMRSPRAAIAPSVRRSSNPNIILILADDQGWNGLSVPMDPNVPGSKSDFYETPNLARLAAGGMRFSRGYAAAPLCSPSRHAIQYGQTPAKLHVVHNKQDFVVPGNEATFEARQSMANTIKRAVPEYATAHFGKWHLEPSPLEAGYDESDGATGNKDGNPEDNMSEDPKRSLEISRRGADFIKRTADVNRPFFLQVSYYADHTHYAASEKTTEKYRKKSPSEIHRDPVFAAMNEELDTGVGILLDALEEAGVAEQTFVIYTADNGYQAGWEKEYGKATPLYTSKAFVYEGGIRVPFIVRGPGIDSNTFSAVPVIGYDLFPTVLDILSASDRVPAAVEGGSILSVLINKGKGQVNRTEDFFLFHAPWHKRWPSESSLIKGEYKLVKRWQEGVSELYNLTNDIAESRDLSAVYPERADALNRLMLDYLAKRKPPVLEDYAEANEKKHSTR